MLTRQAGSGRPHKGDTAAIVTENDRPLRAGKRAAKAAGSDLGPVSLAIALENLAGGSPGADGLSGGDSRPDDTPGQRPKIIASGRGAVAEQILQIAFDRGVKVRKDSDLAEILAAVEIESEIPLAALAGVAEILRYLYQTDQAAKLGPGPAGPDAATPQEEKRS